MKVKYVSTYFNYIRSADNKISLTNINKFDSESYLIDDSEYYVNEDNDLHSGVIVTTVNIIYEKIEFA